jgi:hypothetical protein
MCCRQIHMFLTMQIVRYMYGRVNIRTYHDILLNFICYRRKDVFLSNSHGLLNYRDDNAFLKHMLVETLTSNYSLSCSFRDQLSLER